jgi:hypothetical protein
VVRQSGHQSAIFSEGAKWSILAIFHVGHVIECFL